jgi:hypothetical protein
MTQKLRENPAQPPSLREAMRMDATLGGFLGRKGDGEPGTKSLWLGSQYLDVMTAMWKILEHPPHSPPVSSPEVWVKISPWEGRMSMALTPIPLFL